MRPAFTSLKRKYSGKANFYCVSKNTKGITVVPTFLAVIDGKEVGRLTGYVPYDELESFITKWLS
jgi:thioredoxin-like negative regulator of GroEL